MLSVSGKVDNSSRPSFMISVPERGDVRRQPGRDGQLEGGRAEPRGRVHRRHQARLPHLGDAAAAATMRGRAVWGQSGIPSQNV